MAYFPTYDEMRITLDDLTCQIQIQIVVKALLCISGAKLAGSGPVRWNTCTVVFFFGRSTVIGTDGRGISSSLGSRRVLENNKKNGDGSGDISGKGGQGRDGTVELALVMASSA